jgi:hypothetical protein
MSSRCARTKNGQLRFLESRAGCRKSAERAALPLLACATFLDAALLLIPQASAACAGFFLASALSLEAPQARAR